MARLRSVLRDARAMGIRQVDRYLQRSFWELPDEHALRLAYNVLLRREPDETGAAHFRDGLASGELSRDDVLDHLRWSPEFNRGIPARGSQLAHSLHLSRSHFIRSLPEGGRILDLGGSSSYSDWGAMVVMGYPYAFESLTIVDLPPADRHDIYRYADQPTEVATPNGPVRYAYHSMTDLSRYPDGGFDLVYSGQSIEHVTPEEGDEVLAQVHRVLRIGGYLALDTPNAAVCRMQQPGFIDPDHEIEYTAAEMNDKLEKAGFRILEAKGLNYVGGSRARGVFAVEEAVANAGIFAKAKDCYLLAYLAQK
ncbi:MAG TPA: methyltransferase domain-containing protein [Acidimicrobiia bacterium]|nr:methyltransferase domain-containing protein [Acidimicrobiia bacterium]